jgi:hypothetical protein
MRGSWFAIGALAAASGCASILGVRDPSLEWCLRPENAHAFCEDFDHDGPLSAWSVKPTPLPGAARTVVASDDSPPNLLDTSVQPLQRGAANLTGLETAFPGQEFDHVVVALDVRIVSLGYVQDQGVGSGIGFLLIEDTSTAAQEPNLCIGLVLGNGRTIATAAVALVLVPNPTDCFMVDNATAPDGGSGDGGGGSPGPIVLGEVLQNEWQHIVLDIRRDPSGNGSGTIQPTLPGVGAIGAISVDAGYLTSGYPQLGIATSVTGPSGNVEIQFDDVTVDFPAN